MAYITLNKNNFFNNLDIIAKQTKSIDKIAIVLKDNAYGHGIIEIATMAKEYGLKKAVVQNNEEAYKVKNYFDYILVLNDIPTSFNPKIKYTINDLKSISKFPKNTNVELKIDTGMHRNGISIDELESALKMISEYSLNVEAIFTHHRSADDLSSEWFWQNKRFQHIKKSIENFSQLVDVKNLRFHSSNSAALFRHSNFTEDMARVGIAVYGCMEQNSCLEVQGFKPVLSLYATQISSKSLAKGSRLGYGATYELQDKHIVSNYDFGYGDGFLRVLSNRYTTPKGHKLLGRISMDNSSFICDDEEILLFDDAKEVSKVADTIAYEVLTSLKPDIKRKII